MNKNKEKLVQKLYKKISSHKKKKFYSLNIFNRYYY